MLRLEAEGLSYCFKLESQLLPIVARMSLAGMPADRERLEAILAEVTLQIEGREAALRQYLGDQQHEHSDPLEGLIGLVDDAHGPDDVAENHDRYLYGAPREHP